MKNHSSKKLIKNLFRRSAAVFIVIVGVKAFAENAPQSKMSLENLWLRADEKSFQVQAGLKEVEAIEHTVKALPKPYKPSVSANLGYSGAINMRENSHGPLARVSAEWVFWDGGRTNSAEKLLKLSSESAGIRGSIQIIDLKKKIASLYYEIARLEILMEDEKTNYQKLAALKKLLFPRLKVGKIGNSDIEDVSIRMEAAENRIKNTLRITGYRKRQLNLLSGSLADEPLAIEGLTELKGVENSPVSTGAPLTHPALLLARKQVALLEAKKAQRVRELYWPVFGLELYGGYGPHRDAINPLKPEIGAAGLFRVPLTGSGNRTAEMDALQAEIEAATLDLARLEKEFAAASDFLMLAIPASEERTNTYAKSVTRAEKNLAAAYGEFSRGLKSPGDMTSALQNLYELKSVYHDARFEYLVLKAEHYLLYAHQGASQPGSLKK